MRPLRNYTTLKLGVQKLRVRLRLRPLRNYTTLKQVTSYDCDCVCLRPLRNYTTLKPPVAAVNGLTEFETPKKLHYSQTLMSLWKLRRKFETPKKLHYSQTADVRRRLERRFETPKKLHYSQTRDLVSRTGNGLRPLRNYTTLKLACGEYGDNTCLRPLRNYTTLKRTMVLWDRGYVWDP